MKPFRHMDVKTLDHAIRLLMDYGDKARLIAGGTDLLGLLKTKALPAYPELLINIKGIPGLDSIKKNDDGLQLGSLVKLEDIQSPEIKRDYPLLSKAAGSVAMKQIRLYGHPWRKPGPGYPLLVLPLSP